MTSEGGLVEDNDDGLKLANTSTDKQAFSEYLYLNTGGIRLPLIATASMVLAACGGGGRGGDKQQNVPVSPTQPTPNQPSQPNPSQPTPNQPNPSQPTPNQPNPSQPTPNQPNPNQPNPTQPNPNQPSQPNPTQPNPNQPNPSQPNPTQPNPNQPNPNQPNPNQPNPNQPNPAQPISKEAAARFLQQAQFSSKADEISHLQNVGYEGWLDEQFAMPIQITGYDWLMQQGHNTREYYYSIYPADWVGFQQLIASPDTLRKRLAMAWSEIMVIASTGLTLPCRSFAVAAYWDVLNQHAFGNFRDLLKAITLNLCMGDYLDLKSSRKADAKGRRPDENYAREVMQLFTIGLQELNLDATPKLSSGKPIPTYTEQTVSDLAQALTGWNEDNTYNTKSAYDPKFVRAPMVNYPEYHDTRSVTIFGYTVPAGASGEQALEVVLDALSNHPNVAPFISKQLIIKLVTSNPSPAYVARVATVFNNDGTGQRGNLQAVVRAILMDAEARTTPDVSNRVYGKVREPLVRLIQWAHTFSNRQSISGEWKINHTQNATWRVGQSLFRSPSVFNFFYPDFAPNTDAFSQGNYLAPELQIHNETSTAGYINFIKRVIEYGIFYFDDTGRDEVVADYRKEMVLYDQPEALIEHLNLILCAGQLSDDTKKLIIDAMDTIPKNRDNWQTRRVHFALLMVFVSPDYLVQK